MQYDLAISPLRNDTATILMTREDIKRLTSLASCAG